MIKQPPSILNDVIGPIMRGPSSSHTAASVRIGRLTRQMVKGNLREVIVEFDRRGSLATTYHGQGSDFGFVGGLLNYEPQDENLILSIKKAEDKGIKITFEITDYEASHPNTYKVKVVSDLNEEMCLIAISVGGGMIEIQSINNLPVNISGDFFETLLFFKDTNESVIESHKLLIEKSLKDIEHIEGIVKLSQGLINIKTNKRILEEDIHKLSELFEVNRIIQLEPVLPIQSRKNCIVPFGNAKGMLEVGIAQNLSLWELAVLYESTRGNISKEQVIKIMEENIKIMDESIQEGLRGTLYEDRILGPQAWLIGKAKQEGKLIGGDVMNTVTSYITAIMEVKSSMGVIVAAPTAGSCGSLPGTIIGTALEMGKSHDDIVKAMFVAGIIGVFIAGKSGFAAEVGGCQVECGASSGMAAAGLIQLMGGTVQQGIDAASMALQNVLGMVCDPVADRVEVPCLGKNVMAGVNAIACANMVLSGFDKVIPLDETVIAMDKVGRMIPYELRCTGFGGLSITETSKNIFKRLNTLE